MVELLWGQILESVPIPSPKFETVALHETHRLGAEGLPVEHTTTQRVRALVDGVEAYPVRFDNSISAIKVANSGTTSEIYRLDDDFSGVEIVLPESLTKGQIAEIRYTVVFNSSVPDDRNFRRGATPRINDASITVRFDSKKVPARVFWAAWRELARDDKPAFLEPVTLTEYSVTKILASTSLVVGFCWDWDD